MELPIAAYLSRVPCDSLSSAAILNLVCGAVPRQLSLKLLERPASPGKRRAGGSQLAVPRVEAAAKKLPEAKPHPVMSWNPIPVIKRRKPEASPEQAVPTFISAGEQLKRAKLTSEDKEPQNVRVGLRKPYVCPLPQTKSSAQSSPHTESDDLKCLDEKLVQMIEGEIMCKNLGVHWQDIAGLEFAKSAVNEAIVWPLLRPELFTGIRAPPKGLLLFGPPGTGKTLIGKAIASEANATFFNISASSLTSKWIGESEKLVRILFSLANKHQPSVIFIDEIDSLLCSRSENEQESSRRVKTEFLSRLDGATTSKDDRILVIGTTNRPQELDEAMRRRMAKRLYIPLPNAEGRRQLIGHLMSSGGSRHSLREEDFAELVGMTKGYSGADLYILCSEAALNPLRTMGDIRSVSLDEVHPISLSDFHAALRCVKPSVAQKDLEGLQQWNRDYGSFQMDLDSLNT